MPWVPDITPPTVNCAVLYSPKRGGARRAGLQAAVPRNARRKSGGEYVTHTGVLKRVDEVERMVVFKDGLRVPLDEVMDIKCEQLR